MTAHAESLAPRLLGAAAAASRDDARVCAELARVHARTFHAASRLLPAEKRRAAFALYAFCRLVDDAVDTPGQSAAKSAQLLADAERRLDATLAGHPPDAVHRELHRALARFDVPAATLRELLGGVARDVEPTAFATWPELAEYCAGVASSVGEMCVHVFGVEGGAAERRRAVHHARTLGTAMQLTNVLRDVGEDARRGRCYLPIDELTDFGLSRDEVLHDASIGRDPRWASLIAFQIRRARALYDEARPGLALLSPDAVRCARACADGYAAILDAIEARRYDTISARARVSSATRLAVLWRAWRGAA